jgi:nicotinate-nucleotide adenylyltransferase
MKLGILGGTYDPPHLGHLAMAESARKALDLAGAILIPAGQPMSKTNEKITPAHHRLAMVRLAAAGLPGLKVCDMEVKRSGPSYTVATLAELLKRSGGRDELYFIMGLDSLAQFAGWHEPARIIDLCHLVIVPRPGWRRPGLKALEKKVPGISGRVIFLDKPRLDISATRIRELAAAGKPLQKYVPEAVAMYIRENRIYRGL